MTFQRFWHYITREPVVNLVVIGEEPGRLPTPSKTRQLTSPLIYTVTRHDPKSGETEIETTWTGSLSAQRILVAVRYALENGVVPKEGGLISEGLADTTAAKGGQWLLWVMLALFLVFVVAGLLGAIFALL